MVEFNDRRPVAPRPRTKPDVNGHLVNDHEFTGGGAGSSPRNLPRAEELHRQHDQLHAAGIDAGHRHLPTLPPVRGRWDLRDHIETSGAHPEVVEASEHTNSYLKMLHESLHEHPNVTHTH